MILNEVDNSIDFDYATVTSGGSPTNDGGVSATVGLQGSPTVANQYSFNTASLTDGQNIHWMLSSPTVFTDSKTVTLDVGAPMIFVIPNPLTDTAPAGGSVTTPLYLLNTGDRDLNWNLTEALPASHFPPVPAFTVPFHSPKDSHAGPDPHAQHAAGSKAHPRVPFAPGAVATFAETLSSSPLAYVTFDASAPGTLTPIATFSNMFFDGTFANNDFTREYAADYPAGDLYTIDTTTGAQALIGSTGTPPGSVTGIRWDSSTGNTYLMASTCSGSTLYTMDLSSGATTLVGSSSGTCIIDIAIDPSGLMYGVDIVADTLVAIDKTTGGLRWQHRHSVLGRLRRGYPHRQHVYDQPDDRPGNHNQPDRRRIRLRNGCGRDRGGWRTLFKPAGYSVAVGKPDQRHRRSGSLLGGRCDYGRDRSDAGPVQRHDLRQQQRSDQSDDRGSRHVHRNHRGRDRSHLCGWFRRTVIQASELFEALGLIDMAPPVKGGAFFCAHDGAYYRDRDTRCQ
jgi:hypothetical protein